MIAHLIKLTEDIPERDLEEHENGTFSLTLTLDEWDALRAILLSLKLSDLLDQQRMIRAFPKLLNAVKLVLAIEDHPSGNPTETVKLGPKTRKQLEKAITDSES